MATRLGVHAPRLAAVRALQTTKERRLQGRFAFEGATLLREAVRSGVFIDELYASQEAYDAQALVGEVEAAGTPTFIVDSRSASKISDLESPPGILAIARAALTPIESLAARDGVLLTLGDLNDPGNAGTLLRAADAFGAGGVAFGSLGVDPYHPKVVRAAMGAIFRVPLAEVEPADLASAAAASGSTIAGLSVSGSSIGDYGWPARLALIVGHERRGLGRWEPLCGTLLRIPMAGSAESLNAAIAGSIALYEAVKGPVFEGR